MCVFFSLLLVAPGVLCSLFSFPKIYFEEFQTQKSWKNNTVPHHFPGALVWIVVSRGAWNQSLRDNHTTYTKHPERAIINILPPFFHELYFSMHINMWCLCECPCTHASTLGFGPTICKKIAGTDTRHPYNFRKYFLQITRFLHITSMSLSQKIGKNSLCLLFAISYSKSPESPQKSFRAVPTPIRPSQCRVQGRCMHCLFLYWADLNLEESPNFAHGTTILRRSCQWNVPCSSCVCLSSVPLIFLSPVLLLKWKLHQKAWWDFR